MANEWNNVKPVGCKPWLVLPAVYSDALSYGDQIAHFCAALNKLIQNNNTLPEYIQQMIQDYINGEVIGEVVQNIVSQFILNVKYPPENLKPAVGDGSADDTEAIQGCINYAKNHNGMAVYIPSGAYSVQSLTLPGDVSLFGFDRYTTKLVLRGGATTPLISSVGTGFSIVGLTLDGNAGVQVENINVLSLISQDVLLRDLIVQNGYKLLVYNGTGGHLQVNDVVFGSAVYDCVEISGGSMVQFDNCQFTALSQVSGQQVIDISSNGGVYDFVNSAVCPVCCVVSGNDNQIQFSSNGAQNNFSDTGLRNNIIVNGQEVKEYLSNDFNSTIEGSYGQNVNGAYSENISGAFTSVRNGTESKTVTNASIENYNDTQTENIANKKTINAKDIYLNPTNPLTYKTPIQNNNYFSTIPFKDTNNNSYDVLVKTDNTFNISNYHTFEEFGAIGDGITDDTIAFNTALSSNYTSFKLLANKTYLINGNIFITKNNTHITGEENSCVKCANNSYLNMFSLFIVQGTPLTNIEFDNFTIDGNAENNIDYGEPDNGNLPPNYGGRVLALINLTRCTNVHIHNMKILNAWNGGIWVSDCINCNISNNYVEYCRVHGISIRNNESYAESSYNNIVANNIINHSVVGIEIIFGAYNTICDGNIISYCSDTEKFPSYAFNGAYPNIYPKDDRFKTSSEEGYVSAAQQGDGAGIETTGSITSQTAQPDTSIVYSNNSVSLCINGLRVEEMSNDISITGNNVRQCSTNGIFIFSATKVSINNNVINYNNNGINISQLTNYTKPSEIIIMGNTISANTNVGLLINADSGIISNNGFNDNLLGIYSDISSKNILITGNYFYDYYNAGNLRGIDCSNFDFTNSRINNNLILVTNPIIGANHDNIYAFNDNIGLTTRNYGIGIITESNFELTVNINFPFAPDTGSLMITPITEGLTISITEITATSFTVKGNMIGSFNWLIDMHK